MTETRALLDAELERRVWHANALIGSRLADARAHAERGDLPTASKRLGELGYELVGKLRSVRVDFYRRSHALHRTQGLDPAVHQVGLQPTPEGEHVVRNAKILGRSLESNVTDLLDDAAAALTSVTLSADRPATPAHTAQAMWSNWETNNRKRIVGLARRELSDAQIAIHEAVGRMFVLPNLR
jgi:hypothetical protein